MIGTMADATPASRDRGSILLGFAIAWSRPVSVLRGVVPGGPGLRRSAVDVIILGRARVLFAIPVIVKLNSRGTDKTAKGLLIMSLIGLVLSCGFGLLLFYVMDHLPG